MKLKTNLFIESKTGRKRKYRSPSPEQAHARACALREEARLEVLLQIKSMLSGVTEKSELFERRLAQREAELQKARQLLKNYSYTTAVATKE